MDSERKKVILIRTATVVLALFILLVWSFNLQNIWRIEHAANVASDGQAWQDLKDNLSQTLAEARTELDKLDQDKKEKDGVKNAAFLNDLLDETKRLASSAPLIATSAPATTTPPNAITALPTEAAPRETSPDCPAYIDCMPTIGSAQPCQIPVGCEGITEIAY
ncbi:MAG: hypothetical protein WC456_02845 [Patescibacteria group bacterium]